MVKRKRFIKVQATISSKTQNDQERAGFIGSEKKRPWLNFRYYHGGTEENCDIIDKDSQSSRLSLRALLLRFEEGMLMFIAVTVSKS